MKTSSAKISTQVEESLTPILISGVVVPAAPVGASRGPRFKLMTRGGVGYSILTDADWDRIFEKYRWDEVRIKGLLDSGTMTIVPKWVFPSGPTGETQRVSMANWILKRMPVPALNEVSAI